MSNCVIKVCDYSGNVLTENEMNLRKDELLLELLNDSMLRTFRTDSEFLLRFLHCTEFNIPLALIKIKNYHNCFIDHPHWFTSKPPLEFKDRLEFKDKTVLNEYDRKGRSILIIKIGKIRTEVSSPQQETQMIELWVEYLAEDYKTQSNGISVILDMKDYSWKLFRWLSPTNIRIALRKIDTYPLKEVVIHIVNTSFLLNASLKLIWPLMNERIKRMFKFHFDSWESLHEYINPDYLPAEYGGTGDDLDFEKANQWIIDKSAKIGERLCKQKLPDM